MLQVQQTCPKCGEKYYFECPCGYGKIEFTTTRTEGEGIITIPSYNKPIPQHKSQ